MFVAVLLGYVVASLLAFCGVINIILLYCDSWEGWDVTMFLHKLTTASMPLAVGVIIYVLVQIAIQLEKLGILQKAAQDRPTPVYRKSRGHRTFGCATDSFVIEPENQAGRSAATVDGHAQPRQPHNAPRPTPQPHPHPQPQHNERPAGLNHHTAPLHPHRQPVEEEEPAPMATYQNASIAARGIQPGSVEPGSYFRMEPVAIPQPVPAAPEEPETPAGDAAPAAPAETPGTKGGEAAPAAPAADAPAPGPAPAPTDPSLNFFRT